MYWEFEIANSKWLKVKSKGNDFEFKYVGIWNNQVQSSAFQEYNVSWSYNYICPWNFIFSGFFCN